MPSKFISRPKDCKPSRSLCPFAVWGLDILGPFPRAQGSYRYLYIVIDKFTK
jgi:hypothetical protein